MSHYSSITKTLSSYYTIGFPDSFYLSCFEIFISFLRVSLDSLERIVGSLSGKCRELAFSQG